MNRKISIGGAITLALMFATATFIMTMIYAQNTFDSRVYSIKERETMYAKLAEVDRLVRQNYYNAIDDEALGDALVRGYISGIEDPYSSYLTAEQYVGQNQAENRMVDIGVVCSQEADGYLLIDEVYPDSPAALSDLQRGDIIVKIDELAVTAENYEQAIDALKGEAGTIVTVVTRRDSIERALPITRRRIDTPLVEGHIIGAAGYLRIKEFAETTPGQFLRLMNNLMEQGASSLIFDVRGVQDGSLESVSAVLDYLLPEGPIVSALYSNRTNESTVLFSSDEQEVTLPMAVLVNSRTEFAAELFAQALKDYNKARIIGVTTFGNGSLQEQKKLSDGSAIELTVGLYQPPFSACFEGVGVRPDYEVKLSPELEKILEDLDEYSDLQLRKALEVVNAVVRDQGGVTEPIVIGPQPTLPDDGTVIGPDGEPAEGEEVGAEGETDGEGDGEAEGEREAGDASSSQATS